MNKSFIGRLAIIFGSLVLSLQLYGLKIIQVLMNFCRILLYFYGLLPFIQQSLHINICFLVVYLQVLPVFTLAKWMMHLVLH